MTDVVMVTQQIGTQQAGRGFGDTFLRLQKAEGNAAFVKGFFSQYVAALVEERIRRLITARIARTSWANALLPELAIIVGHFMTYPLKVIRTRLIQQRNHEKYSGIFSCFVTMRQEEGALSIWRGVLLDTVRVAIGFLLNNYWAHNAITTRLFKKLPRSLAIFAGLPAELLIGIVTFPLSTIVTKLQAQAYNIPKPMRPSIEAEGVIDCCQKTVTKHGLHGLWHGYFGYCLRALAQGLTVTALTHIVWRTGFLRQTLLERRK